MTQIKVDNIADAAGTGAPDFEDGLTVAGSAISTLNTAEYYESGTEPSSPKNGALWKDTANDKLMMYVAGEFKEIELGAIPPREWNVDLSNASYDSVSFSVLPESSAAFGFAFNFDGTKMYIANLGGNNVQQYALSTAFDISTASYDSSSFSFSSQFSANVSGVSISVDGTKMYAVTYQDDAVYQYTLATANDVSSASYDGVSFSVSSQDVNPQDIFINPDGNKMYIVGQVNDSIFEYTLSTPYDLSSASYEGLFNVNSQEGAVTAVTFNPQGTQMFVTGSSSDSVYQYTLSTAYDVTSASYDNASINVNSQESLPQGVAFSGNGEKLFVIGYSSDSVLQYSTGL